MVGKASIRPESKRIRVVVNCSHRKSRPVPDELQLRSVRSEQPSTRVWAWTERLMTSSEPSTSAIDLYAGEHWGIARNLADLNNAGRTVELWITSAGYGLIPASAQIRPYGATFSPGHLDSVSDVKQWWNALSEWRGPDKGPRTITDLVEDDPNSRVLLTVSASYLYACRTDVIRAIGSSKSGRQLSIISAGTKEDAAYGSCLLPGDARLQTALGGTRQALNVRILEALLDQDIIGHEDMSRTLRRMLEDQPAIPRFDRVSATDAEVANFIRTRLESEPDASYTGLLRDFRSNGRACEQKRFAALFRATKRQEP